MEDAPPLFKSYPRLGENIPWTRLGSYPTPVERLSNLGRALRADEIWIKRDDLLSNIYGGNKIRKLEFILADARSRGAKTLITVGGLGSNHTLALAAHSKNLGFRSVLVLFNQPKTHRVRENLILDSYFGAEMHYAGSHAKLPLIVAREFFRYLLSGNKPLYVPAGGTTPLSSLGYVNAAFELRKQVERGEMPKPDYIFVPAGTGGTIAGLILGSILSGLDTKIIGVNVSTKLIINRFAVSRLVGKTFNLMKRHFPNIPRLPSELGIALLDSYIGNGYGHATQRAKEAVKVAALEEGLWIEETYTGKTFAAFLDFIKAHGKGVFLFWHTFNSVDFNGIIEKIDYRSLPSGFHNLFTCPLDY
jgi:1-aminocyclopropane-1-carboxylate deaminase/D-cysteine desulfhydrase-like pyridoxal-dependent ACC family enzyme